MVVDSASNSRDASSCCLQRYGYVVFRGAPKSGKTSLLQLLKSAIIRNRSNPQVFFMPCHQINIAAKETMADYILRKFGKEWQYFETSGIPRSLLVRRLPKSASRTILSSQFSTGESLLHLNISCTNRPVSMCLLIMYLCEQMQPKEKVEKL